MSSRARGKSVWRCIGVRKRTRRCWTSSVSSLSKSSSMARTGSTHLVNNERRLNMRNRLNARTTGAAGIALALISLTAIQGTAQTTTAAAKSAKAAIPRMPDGHPDLQGTYDLATMTPLERFPGDPPVLSKEQADKLQKAEAARRSVNATKLDPNREKLPVGGDKTAGKSFFEILEKAGGGPVGGYDRLWLNQGTSYTE